MVGWGGRVGWWVGVVGWGPIVYYISLQVISGLCSRPSLVPSPYFLCGGGKSRAWYTLSTHAPNISVNLIYKSCIMKKIIFDD